MENVLSLDIFQRSILVSYLGWWKVGKEMELMVPPGYLEGRMYHMVPS